MFPYQNEVFQTHIHDNPMIYYPCSIFDQPTYFYAFSAPESQIFYNKQLTNQEQNLYSFPANSIPPHCPQPQTFNFNVKQSENKVNCIETQSNNKGSENGRKKHKQKYGRNICSNIFHHILKKILYERSFNDEIKSIIKKYKMSITLKQFFTKVEQRKNSLKEYVPFSKLQQFYQGSYNSLSENQETGEVQKILRTLSRLYLKNYHILHIFSSNKIKGGAKDIHVRQNRKILSLIDGTIKLN